MELKGSKTEANLLAAFASKAHSKNLYDSYAYRFAYAGLQQIQDAMYDAARLQATHAKLLYEALYGPVGETLSNLQILLADEVRMAAELRECAKVAQTENLEEAAVLFEETAKINDEHIVMLHKFIHNYANEQVFQKDEPVDWICIACGLVVHEHAAPETCPYCKHPQGLFYVRNLNF